MATVPAWDKLEDFVDTADFAVVATLTPAVGAPRQVSGIYDGPSLEAQMGEYKSQTIDPSFTGKQADFGGIKRGDVIAIPGEGSFSILGKPNPDGTGMAVIKLAPA